MNWCTAGMSNKIVARAPSVPRLGKLGVRTNNMGKRTGTVVRLSNTKNNTLQDLEAGETLLLRSVEGNIFPVGGDMEQNVHRKSHQRDPAAR